jgi:hypothetical protein
MANPNGNCWIPSCPIRLLPRAYAPFQQDSGFDNAPSISPPGVIQHGRTLFR